MIMICVKRMFFKFLFIYIFIHPHPSPPCACLVPSHMSWFVFSTWLCDVRCLDFLFYFSSFTLVIAKDLFKMFLNLRNSMVSDYTWIHEAAKIISVWLAMYCYCFAEAFALKLYITTQQCFPPFPTNPTHPPNTHTHSVLEVIDPSVTSWSIKYTMKCSKTNEQYCSRHNILLTACDVWNKHFLYKCY